MCEAPIITDLALEDRSTVLAKNTPVLQSTFGSARWLRFDHIMRAKLLNTANTEAHGKLLFKTASHLPFSVLIVWSQRLPQNPLGQSHLKELMSSMHLPRTHDSGVQSFMLMSQCVPVYPASHLQTISSSVRFLHSIAWEQFFSHNSRAVKKHLACKLKY